MNKIEIFNEINTDINELSEIRKLINYAGQVENIDNVEFNIIIVDNKRIHQLNKEYRDVDRPTDVITFALEDYRDIDLLEYRLLGDIYISFDKAKEQAYEYGHSLLRELAFLTIHGFLHLLGYDHMNEEEEKIMFSKQEMILGGYGITR